MSGHHGGHPGRRASRRAVRFETGVPLTCDGTGG
jgi:hypothetical protein